MLAGSGQRRAVASVRVAGYLPADGMNAPQRSHGLHDDDSDLLVRAVRSEPELSAKVDALFSSLMGRVGELRSSKLVQDATALHSHVRRQLLWVSESLKSGKSRAPSGPEAVVTAKGRSALAAARRMAEGNVPIYVFGERGRGEAAPPLLDSIVLVQWHPVGRRVAYADDQQRSVVVSDIGFGVCRETCVRLEHPVMKRDRVRSLAWSHCSANVLFVGLAGSVGIWRIEGLGRTPTPEASMRLLRLPGCSSAVSALCVDPRGRRAVAACADGSTFAIDAFTGDAERVASSSHAAIGAHFGASGEHCCVAYRDSSAAEILIFETMRWRAERWSVAPSMVASHAPFPFGSSWICGGEACSAPGNVRVGVISAPSFAPAVDGAVSSTTILSTQGATQGPLADLRNLLAHPSGAQRHPKIGSLDFHPSGRLLALGCVLISEGNLDRAALAAWEVALEAAAGTGEEVRLDGRAPEGTENPLGDAEMEEMDQCVLVMTITQKPSLRGTLLAVVRPDEAKLEQLRFSTERVPSPAEAFGDAMKDWPAEEIDAPRAAAAESVGHVASKRAPLVSFANEHTTNSMKESPDGYAIVAYGGEANPSHSEGQLSVAWRGKNGLQIYDVAMV